MLELEEEEEEEAEEAEEYIDEPFKIIELENYAEEIRENLKEYENNLDIKKQIRKIEKDFDRKSTYDTDAIHTTIKNQNISSNG